MCEREMGEKGMEKVEEVVVGGRRIEMCWGGEGEGGSGMLDLQKYIRKLKSISM